LNNKEPYIQFFLTDRKIDKCLKPESNDSMALASENVSLTTVSYKINHGIDFTLGRRGATPFT
jgi:hypothetical protein